MSNAQAKKTGSKIPVIGVVAVFALILILLVPVIPRSYTAVESTVTTQTNTVPSIHVTTTTVVSTQTIMIPDIRVITATVPVQKLQSQNQNLLNLNSYTLQPNKYVYGYGQIPGGSDVAITWSAADTVSVYAFNSDQFNVYQNGGSANPVATQTNVASGTLGFHASAGDTYYIVVFNPHNGILGLGSKTVGVYSASGVATWQQTITVNTNQIQTITTSTTTVQTVTNTQVQTITTSTTTLQAVTTTQSVPKQTTISILDMLLGRSP